MQLHMESMKYINLEYHPNDSRVRIADDEICQTLTSRMGTGGGNIPIVMFVKQRRTTHKDDYETWVESEVANTINTFDLGDVRSTTIVVDETEDINGEKVL